MLYILPGKRCFLRVKWSSSIRGVIVNGSNSPYVLNLLTNRNLNLWYQQFSIRFKSREGAGRTNFLFPCCRKVWQILATNPINQYSKYSYFDQRRFSHGRRIWNAVIWVFSVLSANPINSKFCLVFDRITLTTQEFSPTDLILASVKDIVIFSLPNKLLSKPLCHILIPYLPCLLSLALSLCFEQDTIHTI